MRASGILFVLLVIIISRAAGQIPIQQFRTQYNRTFKKNTSDTIPDGWRVGGLYNLTVNQAALSNWSAGGDKSSISLSTLLSTYAFYKDKRQSWESNLDMTYGLVNTTSLGTRKSDDRIDLISKYGYDLGSKVYFTGLFNFRTQFTKGYSYLTEDTKLLTSNFAAPAYILFSVGLDYRIHPHLSVFLSPATTRWVIVNNDSLAKAGAFGVDSGRHSRLEFGSFASIKYENTFNTIISYKTRLDLFSNYLRRPQDINIYWTNILSVKLFKLLSLNLSLDMIYDNDIKSVKADGSSGGPALQLKEVVGIGLAYQFHHHTRKRPSLPVVIPMVTPW